MRLTEDYSEDQIELLSIISANYAGNLAIHIIFNNGYNKLVDFRPFLESSLHPSIRKYLDENKFKEFEIVDGNLNWNDYDLIFPIDDLYKGII